MIVKYGNKFLKYTNNLLVFNPTVNPTPGNVVTDQLFINLDATNYSGTGQWIDNTINGNNATINGAT